MRYPFGKGRAALTPYLLILPGLLLYFLVALGPSIATFGYSFTDASGLGGADVNWIGMENYDEFLFDGIRKFFDDGGFFGGGALEGAARDNFGALQRTIVFSIAVSSLQFGIGLLLAMILNRGLFGTRFFRTLFFLPVILGVVIQGLMWKLTLDPFGGPFVSFLQSLGIRGYVPLGGTQAFWWVVFVQIWANTGITMVIFIAGLQTIPEELYEAARIDGAGGWAMFRGITWPMLTPSVNTNILLNIIGSLQAWTLFWVLIGYRPGTQVLGYVIYAQGFGQTGGQTTGFRQGYAAAASIVLFVIVLVVGLAVQWWVNRREVNTFGGDL